VIAAWIAIKWLAGSPIPLSDITDDVLFPTWPFGTWSITLELHFYLLFRCCYSCSAAGRCRSCCLL